jgi:uncharacterized protein
MTQSSAPPAFHVMIKPAGAVCNLACRYCFFLLKKNLYPHSRFRMSDELLEHFTRQYLVSLQAPHATIAWQGGEPTLMGLDFYRRSVEYARRYQKPNTTLEFTMQTNGTMLDDAWCRFFREEDFLIGLSLDGPREMHDTYRMDKNGKGSFERVMRGLRLLQEHRVDVNILCTVHAANAAHPREVYDFLRKEAGVKHIQFIPIVERVSERGYQEGNTVTDRSVEAEAYGKFLNAIFDVWVRRDVGKIFVQIFEATLAAWADRPSPLCIFAPTCGAALALEHNGDLYACDHFVEPDYLLGNIRDKHLLKLVGSEAQHKFGRDKLDRLPRFCLDCDVRFACNGGCPKNRFVDTPDGEPGLNYLCRGYKMFFHHVDRPMQIMADLLRHNRAPAEVMNKITA